MRILSRAVQHGRLLVATDGSAVGRGEHRVASIGVATIAGKFGAAVPTADQAAVHSEMWALLQLLVACHNLPELKHMDVIIDNLYVVRWARAAKRVGANFASEERPAFWAKIASLIPSDFHFHWIPSHGKQEDWTAPAPHSTKHWRALNDSADTAATAVTDATYQHGQLQRALETRIADATTTALKAMREAVDRLRDHGKARGYSSYPACA